MQHIPAARYFLYVGGALLALLFIVDGILPKIPVVDKVEQQAFLIRIHSDRKWPERVVYDTSQPTIIPAQIANADVDLPGGPSAADNSAAAGAREAFAQMLPTEPSRLTPSAPRARAAAHHHSRKIASKKRAVPLQFVVAREPSFGWFGTRIW